MASVDGEVKDECIQPSVNTEVKDECIQPSVNTEVKDECIQPLVDSEDKDECIQVVRFPKNSTVNDQLKIIANDTETSIKIFVEIKGNPEKVENARKKISGSKYPDMMNSTVPVNLSETFLTIKKNMFEVQSVTNQLLTKDLNFIKKEISELKLQKIATAKEFQDLLQAIKFNPEIQNLKYEFQENNKMVKSSDETLRQFKNNFQSQVKENNSKNEDILYQLQMMEKQIRDIDIKMKRMQQSVDCL